VEIFYLEVDNKDKICCFHGGNLIQPPDSLQYPPEEQIIFFQCCMKPLGSRGCLLGRHQPNTAYSNKTKKDVSVNESLARVELDVFEQAIRSVFTGIKEIFNLMQSHAPTSSVVGSCKQLVSNIHSLESQTKSINFQPLIQSLDSFKTAISHIIKSVQIVCKSNYQDVEGQKDVKNSCNAAVSAAKILIAQMKQVPNHLFQSKSSNSYAPSGPPPPPPMSGAPPPPPMSGGPPPPPMPNGSSTGGMKKKGKGDLFGAIGGFNKGMLKKAVTVDKSVPVRTAEIEEEPG